MIVVILGMLTTGGWDGDWFYGAELGLDYTCVLVCLVSENLSGCLDSFRFQNEEKYLIIKGHET